MIGHLKITLNPVHHQFKLPHVHIIANGMFPQMSHYRSVSPRIIQTTKLHLIKLSTKKSKIKVSLRWRRKKINFSCVEKYCAIDKNNEATSKLDFESKRNTQKPSSSKNDTKKYVYVCVQHANRHH
jgi:hypothetical protein